MSRHTITEEELDEWLQSDPWKQFAAGGGNGSHKLFHINVIDGRTRVLDHDVAIYEGADRAAAIRAYNEAP